MHDPRIGRFFAIDPLSPQYPHYTPYSFSGNKLIHKVELEGLEEGDLPIYRDNGSIVGDYGEQGTLVNSTEFDITQMPTELTVFYQVALSFYNIIDAANIVVNNTNLMNNGSQSAESIEQLDAETKRALANLFVEGAANSASGKVFKGASYLLRGTYGLFASKVLRSGVPTPPVGTGTVLREAPVGTGTVLRETAPSSGSFLSSYPNETAFSGVFNAKTGKISFKPSFDGPISKTPEGWVPRNTGHGKMANEMLRDGASKEDLFAVTIKMSNGRASIISYNSGSVNRRFHGDSSASRAHSSDISKAIESNYGVPVD